MSRLFASLRRLLPGGGKRWSLPEEAVALRRARQRNAAAVRLARRRYQPTGNVVEDMATGARGQPR